MNQEHLSKSWTSYVIHAPVHCISLQLAPAHHWELDRVKFENDVQIYILFHSRISAAAWRYLMEKKIRPFAIFSSVNNVNNFASSFKVHYKRWRNSTFNDERSWFIFEIVNQCKETLWHSPTNLLFFVVSTQIRLNYMGYNDDNKSGNNETWCD